MRILEFQKFSLEASCSCTECLRFKKFRGLCGVPYTQLILPTVDCLGSRMHDSMHDMDVDRLGIGCGFLTPQAPVWHLQVGGACSCGCVTQLLWKFVQLVYLAPSNAVGSSRGFLCNSYILGLSVQFVYLGAFRAVCIFEGFLCSLYIWGLSVQFVYLGASILSSWALMKWILKEVRPRMANRSDFSEDTATLPSPNPVYIQASTAFTAVF